MLDESPPAPRMTGPITFSQVECLLAPLPPLTLPEIAPKLVQDRREVMQKHIDTINQYYPDLYKYVEYPSITPRVIYLTYLDSISKRTSPISLLKHSEYVKKVIYNLHDRHLDEDLEISIPTPEIEIPPPLPETPRSPPPPPEIVHIPEPESIPVPKKLPEPKRKHKPKVKDSKNRHWTEHEEKIFIKIYTERGYKNCFDEIATRLGDRSLTQCKYLYHRLIKEGKIPPLSKKKQLGNRKKYKKTNIYFESSSDEEDSPPPRLSTQKKGKKEQTDLLSGEKFPDAVSFVRGLTFFTPTSAVYVGHDSENRNLLIQQNPIPHVIDPMTHYRYVQPVVLPDGTVLEYSYFDSMHWKFSVDKMTKPDFDSSRVPINPYTGKPLCQMRSATPLTGANFDQWKHKIMRQSCPLPEDEN